MANRYIPERLLRDLGFTDAVPAFDVPVRALAGPRQDLRPSELDVLRCVSRGLGARETADALGRKEETVRRQLSTARYRLRAKTSAHAACEALRRGLID